MSHENLKDRLARHYGDQALESSKVQSLLAMVQVSVAAESRPVIRRLPWFGFGTAVGLAASLVFLFVGRVAPVDSQPDVADDLPRYALVKFHYNGCPISASTAPVLAKMQNEYGGAVMILTLNITNSEAKEISRNYAAKLGMAWLCGQDVKSGMIKLVDRTKHEVLATLTEKDDAPRLEDALAAVLN